MSAAEFQTRLVEFQKAGHRHNQKLLQFLASSPHGEPLLGRELARLGISRADFERSRTIDIITENVPTP